MRAVLALAALLALATLVPLASASGPALAIEGPDGTVQAQGETQVPLVVHVVLADTVCGGDAQVHVRLAAYGPSSAQVSIPEEVVVDVPAGGYLSTPYEADASATLTILASPGTSGEVMVAGGYDVPPECTSMGDSSAQGQLQVRFAAGAAPSDPTPQAPSDPGSTPASAPAADPSPPAPRGSFGLVALLLGAGVVGTLFFALGRLGHIGEGGGRDGLP